MLFVFLDQANTFAWVWNLSNEKLRFVISRFHEACLFFIRLCSSTAASLESSVNKTIHVSGLNASLKIVSISLLCKQCSISFTSGTRPNPVKILEQVGFFRVKYNPEPKAVPLGNLKTMFLLGHLSYGNLF